MGWRLQYRYKKIFSHEYLLFDSVPAYGDETKDMINRLFIEQLLDTLPDKGRVILQKLYLEEKTEAEVGAQMHISQQGVNKWKKKMLNQLSQTGNF